MVRNNSFGHLLYPDSLSQSGSQQQFYPEHLHQINKSSYDTSSEALIELPLLKLPSKQPGRSLLSRTRHMPSSQLQTENAAEEQFHDTTDGTLEAYRESGGIRIERLTTIPTKAFSILVGRNRDTDNHFSQYNTIPMLVLKGLESQEGTRQSILNSEISGAAGGAAIIGVGNILGTLLKYSSNFLIQRGFGAALYGLYSIGFSLVSLLAAVFDLGLDSAMIRYVAIYRSKHKVNSLQGLTIVCSLMTGVIGILGAIALLLYAPWLAAFRKEPQLVLLLIIMAPMVPLLSMQVVWFGGLQGCKAFKWRVLAERLLPPLTLIFLLGVALLFYRNIISVAFATLISTLVGTILGLYFLFRIVSRMHRQEADFSELPNWIGFAIPNFLTSIIDVIIESIDVLLLTFFLAPNIEIGQYATSGKISDVILMPLFSFNAMFAPMIAELHSNGEQQKLTVMFQIVTKWTIIFCLPLFLIAILFARPILGLSGASFIAAWPLLIILAIGSMINAGTGSVGNMLLMTGHQKISLLDSLLAVVISIVLGAFLTSQYGAIGTAISTTIAVASTNILKLLQVRFFLKMQPYRRDILKPLCAGSVSFVLIGGILFLLGDAYLLLQLLLIPVFLGSYIGLITLFRISPEDKIVVTVLHKKIKRIKK